jgi:hypothetical protein
MGLETWIYIGIFVTSLIYAVVLQVWWRLDPDSFEENTWFLVVIGVTYVGLWLKPIVPAEYWNKFFLGFVVACVPVIFRSLYNNAVRNRRFLQWLDRWRGRE